MPYSYPFNHDNYDHYHNSSFYNNTVIYNRDIISYMMGSLLLIGGVSLAYNCYEIWLKKYKESKFNKNLKQFLILKDSPEICTICLETYIKQSKIVRLDCQHIFHKQCIQLWFKNKPLKQCPLCRKTLYKDI